MTKRKLRKGTQLSFANPKNAGRPAIYDRGIRHTKREEIIGARPLHLTIKLIRADIQNKIILKGLRYAIMRARLQGLRIIHYSLEHDHVHLYAESDNNETLGRAMKALGVTLVKRINRHFKKSGSCYKTRYHLRILRSAADVKNVLNYILKNGIKHKRTKSIIDPYNSALVLHDHKIVGMKIIKAYIQIQPDYLILKNVLDDLVVYKKELRFV